MKDIRNETSASGKSINLALSVRGLAGLKRAGIDDAILSTLIPMKGRMIHSVDGGLSAQQYGVFGECINSVDRKLINAHLLTEAEKFANVNVYFEHSLQSVDLDEKTLVFENAHGSKSITSADLVIGADGAYSRVRRALMSKVRMDFSQFYIDHGYVELNMPPTASGEYAMDPNHLHIWPRHEFMMIALPNIDKSFTVTLFMPWKQFELIKTQSDLISFFQTHFADSILLLGQDLLVTSYFKNPHGSLVSIKASPYHYKDRALIIGDAAHAMVPFYGQGMNCGFEDTLILDDLFTKHLGRPSDASLATSKTSITSSGITVPTAEQLERILTEYTQIRNPDAEAICDLAMANYVEMRSSVTKVSYLIRKKVETVLHKVFPSLVIPLYSMVSFSRIPYAEAKRRARVQQAWFETVGWASLVGALGLFGVAVGRKLLSHV